MSEKKKPELFQLNDFSGKDRHFIQANRKDSG